MAQKFDFSLDTLNQPRPEQVDRGRCEVYGCPWPATIYEASGHGNCRYHAGKKGSELSHITMMLKNHSEEFHWYEFVLTRTLVDFAMGDVEKKAPEHLRVLPQETFRDYRERVRKHIDGLLKVKSRLQEVTQ